MGKNPNMLEQLHHLREEQIVHRKVVDQRLDEINKRLDVEHDTLMAIMHYVKEIACNEPAAPKHPLGDLNDDRGRDDPTVAQ